MAQAKQDAGNAKQRKWHARHKVVYSVAVAFIVLIFLGLLGSSTKNQNAPTSQSSALDRVGVGDTIKGPDMDIRVISVATSSTVVDGYGSSYSASPGAVYLEVITEYINTSNKPIDMLSYNTPGDIQSLAVRDPNGYEYPITDPGSGWGYTFASKYTNKSCSLELYPGVACVDPHVFEVSTKTYATPSWYLVFNGDDSLEVNIR